MPVVEDLLLPGLAATLRVLSEVLPDAWLLVGALARDLRLYRLPHPPSESELRTKDADVGVRVASAAAFSSIRESLIAQGWQAVGSVEHKLLSPFGIEVDVVPFGDVEAPSGHVTLDDGGFQMNVTGYRTAFEAATWVQMEGVPVRVITLPFYALLKCLAWEDRRDRTRKDAEDLARVFDRYEDTWMQEEDGRLVGAHLDVFDLESDRLAMAARVLGRETRRAAASDHLLIAGITRWLSVQASEGYRRIVAEMGSVILEAERRQAAWEAFERGWSDAPHEEAAAPR